VSRLDRVAPYGTDADPELVRAAFRSGDIPVAVVGLGKMGLPLAAVYADVTGNTVGVDVDADRVATVERGGCPVDDEPNLDGLVDRTVESGALRATVDGAAAADAAAVHVLIVPTTVETSGGADLTALRSAARNVAAGLSPGDLVVVESTVPPRTCADGLEPLLAAESGLDPADFGLAFCPERTSSGRALRDIREAYPKVVGGVDEASTRAAALVYDEVTDNDVLTVDATTAECVKLFEGIYRDVNIALANELATFADELDTSVTDAIEVANTLPMCDIHEPGAGVGGHCIPYYPHFLLSEFETEGPLMRTARRVNDAMPSFVVARLRERLERVGTPVDDATVVLLGATYRPGVEETRRSPAIPIAETLAGLGAEVHGTDPMLDDATGLPFDLIDLGDLPGVDPDAVVLVTAHEAFEDLAWEAFGPAVVVDGRGALDIGDTHHHVYTIGEG